ncbi:hypothetical protein GCM10008986_11470 [Salinibacillus aidingensis]|uniref:DUF1934 domain-containing protein n=2 Tax=Salinibacillus aidingensis TaxID=237684 RepID=A0ABN1B0V7_9BACI
MATEPMSVKVTVKTDITDDNAREQMDVTGRGKCYDNGDSLVLIFNEKDEDGNSVKNMTTITSDKVTIKRKGTVKMNQIFRENRATESTYYHPYGTMHMETKTNQIDFSRSGNGDEGRLLISYSLSLNQQEPQRHKLTLTYERE